MLGKKVGIDLGTSTVRLVIKGEKFNRSIVVPSYVRDIIKVQIWCAFAETLLGEASFEAPVK